MLSSQTEGANAIRSTTFWNSLLCIPVFLFFLAGWLGAGSSMASVLVPLVLLAVFAGCTCFSISKSRALAESASYPKDVAEARGSFQAQMQQLQSQGSQMLNRISDPGPTTIGTGSLPRANSGGSSGNMFQGSGAPVRLRVSDPSAAPNPFSSYGNPGFGGFGGFAAGAAAAAATGPPGGARGNRWQVEMESGKWVDFDENEQRLFATAKANGLKSVEFSGRGFRYMLDFENFVQRNVTTGKERPVRFLSADGPVDGPGPTSVPISRPPATMVAGTPVWQVQMGDGGNWVDFEGEPLAAIVRAHAMGSPSALYNLHRQEYEINFTQGVQRNVKTGKERPVRIKPQDAGHTLV
mmetsp:Transcript_148705/g.277151  ORF Transcript_148705/g.277151 Transcript_148705/m.277151 type:complete len:352 (+) Transcript_148705:40-1095(+)